MRAYVVHEFGDNAKFEAAEIDAPTATEKHLVIKVKASSLNPVDHKILGMGRGLNPDPPSVLHMDVAGIVDAVGAGVSGFKPGDEVYACAGGLKGPAGSLPGALADFMLADAALVAHKPKTLDFAEASALPLVAITAWEALFDRTKITAADHVLIHGGTGGVGHIAIQLAKSIGARVAATVSNDAKAKIAKDLGADDIINYRDEDVADYVPRLTGGKGFDVVFDTAGGATLGQSLAAARTSGQVAGIVGAGQHELGPMHQKGLTLHLVLMLLPMMTGKGRAHHGEILTEVAKLVDAGKVKPLIAEKRFKFSEANEAHAYYASGKHVGKIVLENK